MKLVILDTEQQAILGHALAAAEGFLSARIDRRDPAGFLSRAYRLQSRKIENIRFQLGQPPVAGWRDVPTAPREDFQRLVFAFNEAKTDHMRHILYNQMLSLMLSIRAEPEVSELADSRLTGVLMEK